MIQELKIRNFLSFKEEQTFSFEATADKSYEDYYVTEIVPGVRLLKVCLVYGANASGKSNLIDAFQFVKNIIREKPEDKNKKTGFVPFMFDDTKDQSGSFELIFYADKDKFVYKIELDQDKIWEESLYFYPGTQPALLFKRMYDETSDESVISFGSKVKIDKETVKTLKSYVLKNTSFFIGYAAVNYSNPELDKVIGWFQNQFLDSINPSIPLTEYTTERIKENDELRKFAIEFMDKAQYNISDIKISTETRKIPEDILKALQRSDMPEEDKKQFLSEMSTENKLEFVHEVLVDKQKKQFSLPETYQSAGTLRYYGFTAPIFKAFQNDAFLAVDELESKLHPHLVKHLVKELLMKGRKYKEAQFLFTTHNTSLLNEKDMLRKDAVWFTEKQEDGSSDLFSLADFDIRKSLSYYNAYNIGRFGAVPELD